MVLLWRLDQLDAQVMVWCWPTELALHVNPSKIDVPGAFRLIFNDDKQDRNKEANEFRQNIIHIAGMCTHVEQLIQREPPN